MDTGIKWIAVISIIMLMAGAAVAQGQSGDKAGGTDIGKTGKEIKPDNNDSGKPVQPDERTQKESSSDKGAEEDNEGKSPEKGDGDSKQAGETAKEKIEQKIKEKIEEQVQTGNRGEEQSIEVRERVKEKLEERIHHARNASDNAKQQYTEAKQKYVETKQKGNPDLEQAQAMMQSGTGYMTAWLDRIELQVLDASKMDDQRRVEILEKIEAYQNQTREKRELINNTTSIQELRDVGKDLNDYWGEVRVFIKSVGYQIAAAEMDNIIGNARGLEVRVAEKIAEMDAAGADTSKLEELLNEYQEKVNAAKENVERAQDVLFNASTIEELAEGQNLFQEATNQIRQAFKNVQQMANEYQGEWRFFGNETGEVFATGDGIASITVSGIVVVKGNGSINVTEGSVITTGFGEDFTGDSSITGDGVYVVRGDSVSVNVSGEDIYLFTKGQGSVNLTGNWSYRIKQLPQSDMVSSETTAETLTFGGQ